MRATGATIKQRSPGADGRRAIKTLGASDDVVSFVARKMKAESEAKGHFDKRAFAKAVSVGWNKTKPQAIERMRKNGWCPVLYQPLDVKRKELFTGTERTAFVPTWMYEKTDATHYAAVNYVWIPLRVIANDLKLTKVKLKCWCNRRCIPVLDEELTDHTLKTFHSKTRSGKLEYRLHSSLVSRLAKAIGRSGMAAKYTRWKNEFGKLAAEALAHCTDPKDQSEPADDQPAGSNVQTKADTVADPPEWSPTQYQLQILNAVREYKKAHPERTLTFSDLARQMDKEPNDNQLWKIAKALQEHGWLAAGGIGKSSVGYSLGLESKKDASHNS